MHADHLVRPRRRGGERGDRDGRGVGSEDRRGRERRIRAAEDVFLDRSILHDGLHHQIGWDGLAHRFHAPEDLVGVGAPFLGEPVEALAHRGETAVDRPGSGVVQRDAPPGGRDDLRDAASHLAGADDEDMLEFHGRRLT